MCGEPVKGDVHDGLEKKRFTIIESKTGEIIDLGVMVPVDKILSTAKNHDADFIGLSGLINSIP